MLHPEPKPEPKPAPPPPVTNEPTAQALASTLQQPPQIITTNQQQVSYVTRKPVQTAPTVVTLPQQQQFISTPHRSGSPISLVTQLAAQQKRSGSPIVLTNSQIQALQRSGSPVTVLPPTPTTPQPGNVVYLPQGGNVGGQPKKITVIKGTNSGNIQQVISLPSGGVGTQSVLKTPVQQVVNRQTVNTGGNKKVHVVTLSPQVVQTPNGPRTVTIKKVQQAVVTSGTPTVVTTGGLASTPTATVGASSAQRFTVTRTSDGQIRIIKPQSEVQQTQPQITTLSNPQGLVRVHPTSGVVKNSPQPIVVSTAASPAVQMLTPQRQQSVQPRVITMGSTPLSSRTVPPQVMNGLYA